MSELSEDMRNAIKLTVKETFLNLGLNIQTQEDMMEIQSDMQHLRRTRKAQEALYSKSWWLILGAVISGLLAAVWTGLYEMLHSGPK